MSAYGFSQTLNAFLQELQGVLRQKKDERFRLGLQRKGREWQGALDKFQAMAERGEGSYTELASDYINGQIDQEVGSLNFLEKIRYSTSLELLRGQMLEGVPDIADRAANLALSRDMESLQRISQEGRGPLTPELRELAKQSEEGRELTGRLLKRAVELEQRLGEANTAEEAQAFATEVFDNNPLPQTENPDILEYLQNNNALFAQEAAQAVGSFFPDSPYAGAQAEYQKSGDLSKFISDVNLLATQYPDLKDPNEALAVAEEIEANSLDKTKKLDFINKLHQSQMALGQQLDNILGTEGLTSERGQELMKKTVDEQRQALLASAPPGQREFIQPLLQSFDKTAAQGIDLRVKQIQKEELESAVSTALQTGVSMLRNGSPLEEVRDYLDSLRVVSPWPLGAWDSALRGFESTLQTEAALFRSRNIATDPIGMAFAGADDLPNMEGQVEGFLQIMQATIDNPRAPFGQVLPENWSGSVSDAAHYTFEKYSAAYKTWSGGVLSDDLKTPEGREAVWEYFTSVLPKLEEAGKENFNKYIVYQDGVAQNTMADLPLANQNIVQAGLEEARAEAEQGRSRLRIQQESARNGYLKELEAKASVGGLPEGFEFASWVREPDKSRIIGRQLEATAVKRTYEGIMQRLQKGQPVDGTNPENREALDFMYDRDWGAQLVAQQPAAAEALLTFAESGYIPGNALPLLRSMTDFPDRAQFAYGVLSSLMDSPGINIPEDLARYTVTYNLYQATYGDSAWKQLQEVKRIEQDPNVPNAPELIDLHMEELDSSWSIFGRDLEDIFDIAGVSYDGDVPLDGGSEIMITLRRFAVSHMPLVRWNPEVAMEQAAKQLNKITGEQPVGESVFTFYPVQAKQASAVDRDIRSFIGDRRYRLEGTPKTKLTGEYSLWIYDSQLDHWRLESSSYKPDFSTETRPSSDLGSILGAPDAF